MTWPEGLPPSSKPLSSFTNIRKFLRNLSPKAVPIRSLPVIRLLIIHNDGPSLHKLYICVIILKNHTGRRGLSVSFAARLSAAGTFPGMPGKVPKMQDAIRKVAKS
jgi:hypothetical protein